MCSFKFRDQALWALIAVTACLMFQETVASKERRPEFYEVQRVVREELLARSEYFDNRYIGVSGFLFAEEGWRIRLIQSCDTFPIKSSFDGITIGDLATDMDAEDLWDLNGQYVYLYGRWQGGGGLVEVFHVEPETMWPYTPCD